MEEESIIQDIRNGELKKYICPIVFCSSTAMLSIGSHEVSLKRLATMKAVLDMLNIRHLSKLELKKSFIIAYYESFGRGF